MKPTTSIASVTAFVGYSAFLVWAILWKFGWPRVGTTARIINLVPFAGNTKAELLFNLVVFLPLGVFLGWLAPRWSPIGRVLLVFGFSVMLEIEQYLLAVGCTDVTDVILNTAGGVVGLLLFASFGGRRAQDPRPFQEGDLARGPVHADQVAGP